MSNEKPEPNSLISTIVLKNIEITDLSAHAGNQNTIGLAITIVCTFTVIEHNMH